MDKAVVLKEINLLENDIHDAQQLHAVATMFEMAIHNSKANVSNEILLPAIRSIVNQSLFHYEQLKGSHESLLYVMEKDGDLHE